MGLISDKYIPLIPKKRLGMNILEGVGRVTSLTTGVYGNNGKQAIFFFTEKR